MRGAAMSLRAGLSGLVILLLAAAGVMEENSFGVNYPTHQICALKGSTVEIPCTFIYPASINKKITTVKDSIWFTPNDVIGVHLDPNFSGRMEYLFSKNNCTLRIKNLRDSDAVLYKFRIITNHQKGSFTGEPGVTLSITDLQVQVERDSTTADLRCHSSCTLAGHPSYVWYRNGEKMKEHESYSPISVHDNSRYSCAVKGREELRSPEVWIAGWAVTLPSTQICAVRRSTVDIPCTFSYPTKINEKTTEVLSRLWFKQVNYTPVDLKSDSDYRDRVKFFFSRNNCTLRITDLRGSDSAEYKFRFTTNQPEGWVTTSPGVTLSVTDLQVEAKISGPNVELKCLSSCNTADLSYFWTRNKQKIKERSSLTVSFNDNNKYSCGVRGHEDYPSPEVYAPKPPTVSVSPSAEVLEGTRVTLTCSSDANPAPDYTWYKRTGDQRSPPLSTKKEHDLGSIKASDSGEYYCTAVNIFGEKQSEITKVNVQYAPKPPNVLVSSAEVVEGTPVNLSCTIDANPPANYTWYKKNDDKPKSLDQVFTIMDPRPEHSGTYVCSAQNERGHQNSTILLTVVTGPLKSTMIYATAPAVFIAVILVFVFVWIIKKRTSKQSSQPGDRPDSSEQIQQTEQQNDLQYATVHFSKTKPDAVYSNITPNKPKRHKQKNKEEEDMVVYSTVKFNKARTAQSSCGESVEDPAVLYSTVNKANKKRGRQNL